MTAVTGIWRETTARTMLGSMLISSIGMGLYTLALGQTLFQLTGDAEAFALIFSLQGLGAILVLPFSGPFVDAHDARRIYVACSLLRVATVFGIFAVASAHWGSPLLPIGVAAVLLAVFDNVQRTAFFKFTGHYVAGDRAVRFNSMIGIAIQTGRLTGMAVLGLVLLLGTPIQALLVDVAMSLVAAVLVAMLRTGRTDESPVRTGGGTLRSAIPDMLRDWRQMFRQHRAEPVVFGMVLLCAADFFCSYALSTQVVPVVHDFYGGRAWVVSALEATFGAGMIAATFFTRYTVCQRLLPVWLGLQTAMALLLAFSSAPLVHFPAYFLAGVGNLNSITWLLTTLQQHAGAGDKGKMASLRLLSIGVGTAALMPLLGLASKVSLSTGYLSIVAIMLPFIACGFWVARSFRPRTPDEPSAVDEPFTVGESSPVDDRLSPVSRDPELSPARPA